MAWQGKQLAESNEVVEIIGDFAPWQQSKRVDMHLLCFSILYESKACSKSQLAHESAKDQKQKVVLASQEASKEKAAVRVSGFQNKP